MTQLVIVIFHEVPSFTYSLEINWAKIVMKVEIIIGLAVFQIFKGGECLIKKVYLG